MKKSQLRQIIKEEIKSTLKENEGQKAMEAFLKATERAPNQDEILEKFEDVMNSIFGKGIMKKDVGEKYAKEMRADLVKVLMKEYKINEGKGKALADKVMKIAAKDVKNLNGSELMEFRKWIAKAFDMKEGKLNEKIWIKENYQGRNI